MQILYAMRSQAAHSTQFLNQTLYYSYHKFLWSLIFCHSWWSLCETLCSAINPVPTLSTQLLHLITTQSWSLQSISPLQIFEHLVIGNRWIRCSAQTKHFPTCHTIRPLQNGWSFLSVAITIKLNIHILLPHQSARCWFYRVSSPGTSTWQESWHLVVACNSQSHRCPLWVQSLPL